MTLKFKDGSVLEGEIVSQALVCMIVKSQGLYYLVNKYELEDEDPKLMIKD